MIDYLGALSDGLGAADKLAADQEEVASVVGEASAQIERGTGGTIGLGVRKFSRPKGTGLVSLLSTSLEMTEYSALSFLTKNADHENPLEIARWKANRGGYPVKIIDDDGELTCHDRDGLAQGIANVLASPMTGRKFRQLLTKAGAEFTPKQRSSRPKPAR